MDPERARASEPETAELEADDAVETRSAEGPVVRVGYREPDVVAPEPEVPMLCLARTSTGRGIPAGALVIGATRLVQGAEPMSERDERRLARCWTRSNDVASRERAVVEFAERAWRGGSVVELERNRLRLDGDRLCVLSTADEHEVFAVRLEPDDVAAVRAYLDARDGLGRFAQMLPWDAAEERERARKAVEREEARKAAAERKRARAALGPVWDRSIRQITNIMLWPTAVLVLVALRVDGLPWWGRAIGVVAAIVTYALLATGLRRWK